MASSAHIQESDIYDKSGNLTYSSLYFDDYYEALLDVCNSNKNGSHVLSGVHKDPIQMMRRRKPALVGVLTQENLGDEAQVKKDPKTQCKNLIEELEGKIENAQAQQAGLSLEYLSQVEKRVDKWINGESHIYASVVKTLKNHPGLIVCTEGAGRTALQLLKNAHKKGDNNTTSAWIFIWENWTVLSGETAQAYKARLDRLVKNMSNAQAQKLPRSDAEKRLKYLQGMKRGGRYLAYIKEAERDEIDLNTVHQWMVKKDLLNSNAEAWYAEETKRNLKKRCNNSSIGRSTVMQC